VIEMPQFLRNVLKKTTIAPTRLLNTQHRVHAKSHQLRGHVHFW
jgi:hypothetical protein